MHTLFLALLAALQFLSNAQAEEPGEATPYPFVLLGSENQILLNGTVTPRLKLITENAVAGRWSISGFATIAGSGYAEVYFGPTWRPKKWLALSAGAGLETADSPWRVAGSFMATPGKNRLLLIGETGGTGLWYKALAYRELGSFGLGGIAQRFDGVGPFVGYHIWKLHAWGAPVYDPEAGDIKILAGVNFIP